MKSSIRVLLVNLPPLVRQILEHEIAQQSDCHIVLNDGPDAAGAADDPAEPDAVIIGAEPARAARDAALLLDVWPRAEVLVVSQAGGGASLHEFRHESIELGQISAAELTETIRQAVFQRRREAEF